MSSNDDPASATRETREALDMARMELQRDLSNEALSDSEAADFRAYLLSLEQQLEQQCGALPEHRRPTGVCELAPKKTVNVDTVHEQTEEERSESLDQELEASLSAFDQMLLEEQETLSAQTAREASGGNEDGSDGNEAGDSEGGGNGESRESDQDRGRQSGQQGDANDKDNAGQKAETQDSRKGRKHSQASGRNDPNRPARWEDVAATPGKSSERTADRSREPMDGQDDDVVARQIREAAEKETDPKLREKLWEEYRRYKQGQ